MYGKLFVQMFDGTLGTKGPWQALVTFQQLIILSDKNGHVDMTPEAISRRTTIPLEIVLTGIEALLKPDTASRSPDEEGRRIVPLSDSREWGWKIVNYEHYRQIRSEEERREYHKQYMRNRRAVNQNVKVSTLGDQCQPIAVSSKHKQKAEAINKTRAKLPDWLNIEIWEAYIEMRKKIRKPMTDRAANLALEKLEELRLQGNDPVKVLEQSVLNCWQGLFELKKENAGNGKFNVGATVRSMERALAQEVMDIGPAQTLERDLP